MTLVTSFPKAMPIVRRRGNKFGARPTLFNGRRYASALEAERGAQLQLRERAGDLTDLRMQPRLMLHAGIFYRPDFAYVENGQEYWEDVKGISTERFRLICKLWAVHGPGPLRITRRSGKHGIVIDKTIVPTGGGDA